MTIAELIALLEGLDNKDRRVVLAKDGEGNSFSPLDSHFEGVYKPESTWSGEVYSPEEAEEYLSDFQREDAEDVLVLWPTN